MAGRWFSPISSTNKTDRHDISEILLTVALNIRGRRTDNTWPKKQTMFYKILHRNLKTEQHSNPQKARGELKCCTGKHKYVYIFLKNKTFRNEGGVNGV